VTTYQLLFLIAPPGPFGLPEEDKTVYPGAETAGLVSPVVDTLTGKIVQHGTPSKYRESPLTRELNISGAKLNICDNYIYLDIESADDQQAVERGIEIVNRFCALLSLNSGSYFTAEIVQATTESPQQRRRVPLPQVIPLLSVTAYNLEGLAQQIDATALACSISDPILDKATAYFYHALFMANAKERVTNFLSFHANLIISEIILNYYKAVSTIIGDPSIDRDYQSRYRRFGISPFYGAMQSVCVNSATRMT
jgi:hypothetical protein